MKISLKVQVLQSVALAPVKNLKSRAARKTSRRLFSENRIASEKREKKREGVREGKKVREGQRNNVVERVRKIILRKREIEKE